MIQLVGLSKHYQGRYLFRNVGWQLRDGERVGLTGPNGSGKTTLLRIFSGEVPADDGAVVVPKGTTIGYLPQDGLHAAGRTLIAEMRLAFSELLALEKEQTELTHRLETLAHDDADYLDTVHRFSEAERLFRERGGFDIDGRIAQVLVGLGFSRDEFETDCAHFSGGWQMRIALARLLLMAPNLLLLDEPTNHLDLEARNWLSRFLANYPHSVILVSHDRYFLDAVVQRITEVSPQGLLDFTGGYSRYVVQREEHYQRLADHNRRTRDEIKRLTDLADRFGAKATKASQAQGWRKQAAKLEQDLLPEPPARGTIHFRFPPAPPSGKVALTVENVDKRYGEKTVFTGANFIVTRGERVALVGVNGAGKSSLMRILSGTESHTGVVRLGHGVNLSYFAQNQAEVLDPRKTVLAEAESEAPYAVIPRLRGLLGAFLFSGDDVHKPVGVLSGGERNRLALVKLLLRPANMLLLDEPTNHLDLDSKDILLEALQEFSGTLLFVSHDRYFIEQLATHVIEIDAGCVTSYPGNYADYAWKKEQTFGSAARPPQESTPTAASPPADKARRIAEREAKKALERNRRMLERRNGEVETLIEETEAEIAAVEAALADPGSYTEPESAPELAARLEAARRKLEPLLAEWERLQHDLTAPCGS